MYRVEQYNSAYSGQWDSLIKASKNGTFLFQRNFMEYHSDRFNDFSLLVFDGQKTVAVLPANHKDTTAYSHQGLTYGGLIYTEKLKLPAVISIFKAVLQFLHQNNITTLIVKQVPAIYHKFPSQETDYILFTANAKLVRRDALAVIDRDAKIKTASNRMEGVKKGIANGFTVQEEQDFTAFWEELLVPNLQEKYGVPPVHSLAEITQLKKQFPENIRLFVVKDINRIAAGTLLFETETVVHAQYISSAEDKNINGSLDFLYYHLINETFSNKKYFDFGISNEEQGRKVNNGLQFWKESFGARTVIQDFFEVETANYTLLDTILI